MDSVLNWPMMNETVAKVDQVVHLAAAVGVRKIMEKPVETITTNVRGTEIVLDCCDRHAKPLFIASTAVATVPNAVITITGTSGLSR